MTLDGIDRLGSAERDPVIVLFSDHGSDVGFDPNDAIDSDLVERTSTIVAANTPGRPGIFDRPITPINIIGTLTNAYLGTKVARQPDTSFVYDGSVLNLRPISLTPGD